METTFSARINTILEPNYFDFIAVFFFLKGASFSGESGAQSLSGDIGSVYVSGKEEGSTITKKLSRVISVLTSHQYCL